jgi:phage terminase small subunit
MLKSVEARKPAILKKPRLPQAPRYLQPPTRRWWRRVIEAWQLEEHHIRLLTLASEAWDRCQQAREVLAVQGLTFEDVKLNRPCARPEVAIERDSRLAFARLLRELDLDIEPPASKRPPALRSNRRN